MRQFRKVAFGMVDAAGQVTWGSGVATTRDGTISPVGAHGS
ncbi:hypothetical protein [Nocardia coubleae]|nr:hypothetical protein [Nocardia coubleae]